MVSMREQHPEPENSSRVSDLYCPVFDIARDCVETFRPRSVKRVSDASADVVSCKPGSSSEGKVPSTGLALSTDEQPPRVVISRKASWYLSNARGDDRNLLTSHVREV